MSAILAITLELAQPTSGSAITTVETCALLQAAYRASMGEGHDADLTNVEPAKLDPTPLATFTSAYRRYTSLTADEFADLQRNQATTTSASYVPGCRWRNDNAAQQTSGRTIAFGAPILSTDRRLALVEVSSSQRLSAYGNLCIMRLFSTAWTGRCIKAWSVR